MGDWHQTLLPSSVAADAAGDLADTLLRWLLAERIVAADRTDCVLGAPLGHPPGAAWTAATNDPADVAFLRLKTNGLEVCVERIVAHAMGDTQFYCMACSAVTLRDDEFFGAVGEWFEGDDNANVVCPVCSTAVRLVDARFDPPWGFGNLAFKFWNWPQLSSTFVSRFQRVAGTDIRVVAGKL